jgi:hypothetical protein
MVYYSYTIARFSIAQILLALPSIHPGFCMSSVFAQLDSHILHLEAIPTEPNGGNHTPAFSSAAATLEAHDACLEVCKALALTGVRVIEDDQFYAEVNDSL